MATCSIDKKNSKILSDYIQIKRKSDQSYSQNNASVYAVFVANFDELLCASILISPSFFDVCRY